MCIHVCMCDYFCACVCTCSIHIYANESEEILFVSIRSGFLEAPEPHNSSPVANCANVTVHNTVMVSYNISREL